MSAETDIQIVDKIVANARKAQVAFEAGASQNRYDHAALAVGCETYGQRVEAAVKLCKGSRVTSDELIKLCEKNLGSLNPPISFTYLANCQRAHLVKYNG